MAFSFPITRYRTRKSLVIANHLPIKGICLRNKNSSSDSLQTTNKQRYLRMPEIHLSLLKNKVWEFIVYSSQNAFAIKYEIRDWSLRMFLHIFSNAFKIHCHSNFSINETPGEGWDDKFAQIFTIVKPEESQKALLARGKRIENHQIKFNANKSHVSSHLVKKVCQHTHMLILPKLIAPNENPMALCRILWGFQLSTHEIQQY